jgi:hypothetical protein
MREFGKTENHAGNAKVGKAEPQGRLGPRAVLVPEYRKDLFRPGHFGFVIRVRGNWNFAAVALRTGEDTASESPDVHHRNAVFRAGVYQAVEPGRRPVAADAVTRCRIDHVVIDLSRFHAAASDHLKAGSGFAKGRETGMPDRAARLQAVEYIANALKSFSESVSPFTLPIGS